MLWFLGPVGVALTDVVDVVDEALMEVADVAVASSLASGRGVSAGPGSGEDWSFGEA